MRHSILWKLLGINVLVIGFVTVIVWLAIDYLAAGYFVTLMKKYNISPVSSHEMFIQSVHRYLVWATSAAMILAVTLSYLLTKRVLGPLSRMTDVTRRIAAGDYSETVPIRSHDEVGQLADAFNRMAQSLRALEDLRKNLLINVAHELRTPLTNIQGYLEGLLDGVVCSSRETFELLLEEALRLKDLVESILRLAKADAARTHLRVTDVRFADVIDQALEAFCTKFEARGITVESRVSAEEVVLRADAHKLSQVINNLLQNAIQYTDPGGMLRIDCESVGAGVKVIFANSGGDLSEQDLPFIFERFYRGEKSRSRESGGAGLGLAIVKELVEAHNGKVGAELSPAETRVWFWLPTCPMANPRQINK
jgi:two-component system, OmpR family, sensor histidine kinase BaeS